MSDLKGLELRKAACEALGWSLFRIGEYLQLLMPGGTLAGEQWGKNSAAWPILIDRYAPAIESDPAVSEPLFLEWLSNTQRIARMWMADSECHLELFRNDDEAIADRECGDDTPEFDVRGATPSEARARAIVAAKEKA